MILGKGQVIESQVPKGLERQSSFFRLFAFGRQALQFRFVRLRSTLHDVRAIDIEPGIVPESVRDLFEKDVYGMWHVIQGRHFNHKVVFRLQIAGENYGHADAMRTRAPSRVIRNGEWWEP